MKEYTKEQKKMLLEVVRGGMNIFDARVMIDFFIRSNYIITPDMLKFRKHKRFQKRFKKYYDEICNQHRQ